MFDIIFLQNIIKWEYKIQRQLKTFEQLTTKLASQPGQRATVKPQHCILGLAADQSWFCWCCWPGRCWPRRDCQTEVFTLWMFTDTNTSLGTCLLLAALYHDYNFVMTGDSSRCTWGHDDIAEKKANEAENEFRDDGYDAVCFDYTPIYRPSCTEILLYIST